MNDTLSLVSGLTSLLTLFFLVLKFRGKPEPREITPQPLHVKEHVDPLSREEHARLCAKRDAEITRIHERIDAIAPQITTVFAKLDETARERSNTLHNRIDAIVTPLNVLIGKVDTHIKEHRK